MPINTHDQAYAAKVIAVREKLKDLSDVKAAGGPAGVKPREIGPMTKKDDMAATKQAASIAKDTVKLKVATLNSIYDTMKKERNKALSDKELAEVMSYAMSQEMSKEDIEAVKKVGNFVTGGGLNFKYSDKVTVNSGVNEAMHEATFHLKDVAKKEADHKKGVDMAKAFLNVPQGLKNVSSELHRYKETLKAKAKTEKGLEKGGLFKSDQDAKLKIAEDVAKLLEKPVNATSLAATITSLETKIKANEKATGTKVLHGSGQLSGILKAAKKELIASVPNGEAIIELHKYVAEKEGKKGLASDIAGKVELAKKVLKDLEADKKPDADALGKLREENKKMTTGIGSGKLDSILKGLEAPKAGKTKP